MFERVSFGIEAKERVKVREGIRERHSEGNYTMHADWAVKSKADMKRQ